MAARVKKGIINNMQQKKRITVLVSGATNKSAVQRMIARKTQPMRVKYAAVCAGRKRRIKSWDE